MEMKIRSISAITAFPGMPLWGLFIALFFIGGIHLIPEVAFVGYFSIAALFITAITFLMPDWFRRRKLARLRADGVAYEAEDVAYATTSLFWIPGHKDVKLTATYIDSNGVKHTTKARRCAVSTRFGTVRLHNLTFSATIYVNPQNSQDYAVDFRANVKQ
ncbi:MAG: hypothetical protein FWC76_00675 [Defluviitaleaceae bacterium]|nr:hypothetical protein [Defluviitaleaceae bacterium]